MDEKKRQINEKIQEAKEQSGKMEGVYVFTPILP